MNADHHILQSADNDPAWKAVIEDAKRTHYEATDVGQSGIKDRMIGGMAYQIVILRRQLVAANIKPKA
jgi:hypothetical protein